MFYYDTLPTPIGDIVLAADESGNLTHLYMGKGAVGLPEKLKAVHSSEKLAPWRGQLTEYFAGKRQEFDLPIAPHGTDFQKRVWEALKEIPFGETRSYGQLAAQLGVPNASRAVGRANGTNPISIIVPCHRVIGSTGALTGYGGGIENKKWLLEFETEAQRKTLL